MKGRQMAKATRPTMSLREIAIELIGHDGAVRALASQRAEVKRRDVEALKLYNKAIARTQAKIRRLAAMVPPDDSSVDMRLRLAILGFRDGTTIGGQIVYGP
jgi:hypothetical protein